MSDLYLGGSDADAAYSEQVDHGADSGSDGYGGHSDADVEAIVAEEDQLPSRDESRASTWGDNPEYADETDLAEEYEGDIDALLAAEEDLTSRDESRARTWGDNPEYLNEADLAEDQDENPAVTAATEDRPEAENDPVGRGGKSPDEPEPSCDPLGDSPGSQAAETERSQTVDSDRITDLEARNAQLSNDVLDLRTRLEQLERANQPAPAASITGQERNAAQQEPDRNLKEQGRRLPTNEALAFGAAVAGEVVTTVSDYLPYVHADAAGIAANTVLVGVTGLAWIRARREAKHAHRSKD